MKSRFCGQPKFSCFMSVDGTDSPIQEPIPFSPKWYSQKLNKAGFGYEVGISINSGFICWTNGPFRCGSHNDMNIFNSNLRHQLLLKEKVVADKGYSGRKICPNSPRNRRLHKRIRARHEAVNGMLKSFGVLRMKFRGNLGKHSKCFRAVVALTQLRIELEKGVFSL